MDTRREGDDSEMKRYAVIGNPIGHSLSPIMHNVAFKALGVEARYEALEVEDAGRAWKHLKETYAGINVTIPHKTAVMGLLEKREMAADLIGAVNCVDFRDKPVGYNTDMVGAVEALKEQVPTLRGKRILVLGAGGAARAVVYGCLLEGANISIWNRTQSRAEELAAEIKEGFGPVDVQKRIDLVGFDILINATPVGMHPKVDETPVTSGIPSNLTVMDIVYNPLETKLLKTASEWGAKTVSGLEMFVRQGAESLRIWGYEPSGSVVNKMRRAAIEELQ